MILRGTLTAVLSFAIVLSMSSIAFADAGAGEAVYKKKCKACHSTSSKKVLGPGLAGQMKVHTPEWMKKWLMDPQGTWVAGEAETEEMKTRLKRSKKKKTKMKIKGKGLPEGEANDVIDYLKTL